MSDYIFYLFLILVVLFSFVGFFFIRGLGRKSIANSQKIIDYSHEIIARQEAMSKRDVLSAEALAVNKRLVEQGEETIALLKAIKESLEHRTIKN